MKAEQPLFINDSSAGRKGNMRPCHPGESRFRSDSTHPSLPKVVSPNAVMWRNRNTEVPLLPKKTAALGAWQHLWWPIWHPFLPQPAPKNTQPIHRSFPPLTFQRAAPRLLCTGIISRSPTVPCRCEVSSGCVFRHSSLILFYILPCVPTATVLVCIRDRLVSF